MRTASVRIYVTCQPCTSNRNRCRVHLGIGFWHFEMFEIRAWSEMRSVAVARGSAVGTVWTTAGQQGRLRDDGREMNSRYKKRFEPLFPEIVMSCRRGPAMPEWQSRAHSSQDRSSENRSSKVGTAGVMPQHRQGIAFNRGHLQAESSETL